MRNEFVVLVSLYIGLTSGFIVPSGGVEFMAEDRAILAENNGKDSEENKRTTVQDDIDSGFIVLPFRTINKNHLDLANKQNDIKDMELYDQNSLKKNNVNERSFIYINQKYKTPVVNQLYPSQDLLQETYQAVLANKEDSRKIYPIYQKAPKEQFEAIIRPKVSSKRLFFPPVPHQPQKPAAVNENRKEFNFNQDANKIESTHEYLELLKPPLLRPLVVPDNKKPITIKWVYPESHLNTYQVLNTQNSHKINSAVDSNKLSVTHYDNYGFPTPYGYQRSIPNLNYQPKEKGMDTDINIPKMVDGYYNPDVGSLSNRYMKDSLEEQVMNERMNVKNNCSYNECILKSRKQYIHGRIHNDPECRCGRKSNMKRIRNEEFIGMGTRIITDRPEVVMSTEPYITSRSMESNDYSDMFAEEMNLKKLIEE